MVSRVYCRGRPKREGSLKNVVPTLSLPPAPAAPRDICAFQAAEVEIRVRSPTHMQIDGEPWLQAPAKICIKHYGQSTCLRGR